MKKPFQRCPVCKEYCIADKIGSHLVVHFRNAELTEEEYKQLRKKLREDKKKKNNGTFRDS